MDLLCPAPKVSAKEARTMREKARLRELLKIRSQRLDYVAGIGPFVIAQSSTEGAEFSRLAWKYKLDPEFASEQAVYASARPGSHSGRSRRR